MGVSGPEIKRLKAQKGILKILIQVGVNEEIMDAKGKTAHEYALDAIGKNVDNPVNYLIDRAETIIAAAEEKQRILQKHLFKNVRKTKTEKTTKQQKQYA